MSNNIIDGLVLTGAGLLSVFLFLSLLIFCIHVLTKTASFFTEKNSEKDMSEDEIAAATAAVQQYRVEHEKH